MDAPILKVKHQMRIKKKNHQWLNIYWLDEMRIGIYQQLL